MNQIRYDLRAVSDFAKWWETESFNWNTKKYGKGQKKLDMAILQW